LIPRDAESFDMEFQQFSFPQVVRDLGLTPSESDLFAPVPPIVVRPDFLAQVIEGANLASAINTEKARSEFVVAPILFELRRLHAGRIGLFSGVELEADASRGLNGVCDFLITKSPRQHVLSLPIVTVVEANNENLHSGLGPCIATMVASQLLNQSVPGGSASIHGAVTSGSEWNFLRVVGTDLTIDLVEYRIGNLGKILGILSHPIRGEDATGLQPKWRNRRPDLESEKPP
jgi:hypothetical protein